MNKTLLVGFLIAIATQSLGQGIVVQNSNPTSSIANKGSYIADSIFRIGTRDTVKPSWWNPAWSFNGALQIGLDGKPYYYYGGYWRGVGSGASVTSITQGYGMTLSPNPIVSTGSVRVDTTEISTKANVNSLLSAKVPYTGATTNVNLGEFQASVGQVTLDQTPTQTAGVGVLRWNDSDGTADLGLKGGNVSLQIGQEEVVRVVNKTGGNLLESQYHAVYVSGAQGQRLKVDNAIATSDTTSAATIGLVTENISLNQEGFITTNGLVRNINTTGSLQGETWNDGDLLFLSGTTAGQITNVKPIAPTHTIIIGYVVHAHINQGKIFVKVDNGYELDELHNIRIISAANNQGLFYDSAAKLWENKSISTALGYTPANNANVVKYADTASMLGSYLKKVDTASLSTRINTKLNSADTASLSNRINLKLNSADTASLSNRIDLKLNSADTASLSTRIDARVKYSDTSTMLGGYLRKVDTASLSNRIDAKVGYGTLTTNYVPKATSTTAIGNSQIFDDGTLVGVGTATPTTGFKLDVNGRLKATSINFGTSNTLNPTSTAHIIGESATIETGASFVSALGGFSNTVKSTSYISSILGGNSNTVSGTNNNIAASISVNMTGITGTNNQAVASNGSTIFAGSSARNSFIGANASFINTNKNDNIVMGYNIFAQHDGNFMLGDRASIGAGYLNSTADNRFMSRFQNGYDFKLANNVTALFINSTAQIGIGTTTPNASSILDITSTTQGLGLPSMTTTQQNAIATPRTGLAVYNSTLAAPTYYNGTAWSTFGGASGWGLTGNAGTSAATNFIGTTDDIDLMFRRNNISSGRISANNTAFGNGAGAALSGGGNNALFGAGAGGKLTNPSQNVFFGFNAGSEIVSGFNNIYIGAQAGSSGAHTTGNKNLIISHQGMVATNNGANQLNIGNVLWGVNCTGTNVTAAGRLGVGTNAPNASAILDLTSTTQGFLPPRMTAAQAAAIATPAEGLMVYVTDTGGAFTGKGWWGWNGAAWEKLNP